MLKIEHPDRRAQADSLVAKAESGEPLTGSEQRFMRRTLNNLQTKYDLDLEIATLRSRMAAVAHAFPGDPRKHDYSVHNQRKACVAERKDANVRSKQ